MTVSKQILFAHECKRQIPAEGTALPHARFASESDNAAADARDASAEGGCKAEREYKGSRRPCIASEAFFCETWAL